MSEEFGNLPVQQFLNPIFTGEKWNQVGNVPAKKKPKKTGPKFPHPTGFPTPTGTGFPTGLPSGFPTGDPTDTPTPTPRTRRLAVLAAAILVAVAAIPAGN